MNFISQQIPIKSYQILIQGGFLVSNFSSEKETKEKNEILSPKLDVVFQILFGEVGSEKITKDFLSSILKEKIEEVSLNENIVLRREYPKDKMGVVDVLAKVNGKEYCHIEIQLKEVAHLEERLLYYWAKQYTRSIKSGKEYESLKRTISILITDFEVKGLENIGMHSKWKIIEENSRKQVLTEHLEIHIIEIPKMYKEEKKQNKKLIQWLNFLENPESKEVEEYMRENVNVKEAKEKLEGLSEDERVQRLAELREKAILDEKEAKYTGYMEGLEEGKKDGRREIAKKLKEEGLAIELIMKATELKKEEIEIL